MQVSVKSLTDLERCMTITLPFAELEQAVEQRLKETAQQIKLKGFRHGHVPLGEARRRFGSQVQQEVTQKIMLDSFIKAIEEKSLKPAGSPTFKLPEGEASADVFKFDAIFEVLPQVKLAAFSKVQITKPVAEVTTVDVDAAVEEIRKSRQTFEPEEGRIADEGDQIVVDWVGKVHDKDGKAHEDTRTDLPLVLNREALLPEIIDALKGAKVGDTRTIEIKPPPATDAKAKEGEPEKAQAASDKTNLIECVIKSIAVPKLPELDDQFIAGFGMDVSGIEAFREKIRESMVKRLDRAVWQRVKAQVFEQLAKLHPSVQLPKALIEREVERMKQEAAQRESNQMPSGLDDAKAAEALQLVAANTVKLQLIVEQLVKDQAVEVDPTLVRARIEEIAAGHPEAQKVIDWHYSDEAQFNRIQNMVLEDQIVQKIVDEAKVKEEAQSYSKALGA